MWAPAERKNGPLRTSESKRDPPPPRALKALGGMGAGSQAGAAQGGRLPHVSHQCNSPSTFLTLGPHPRRDTQGRASVRTAHPVSRNAAHCAPRRTLLQRRYRKEMK
jgi:hypothetical protein